MSKYMSLIILILIHGIILLPSCKEGKNNCLKCNYLTKLCAICNKDIFSPDGDGGCKGAKKCIIGKNYCYQCSEDEDKCEKCEIGYFPDENGGCSYTDNCEISYKGECLKCTNSFILTGNKKNNSYLLCKSLNSEDLKGCRQIDINKGVCNICQDGLFLNKGDSHCSKTENCFESTFGICNQCINGYYFNIKNNKCKKQEDSFIHCKITLDGELCDICEDGYYLSQDGNCCQTNFCSKVNLKSDKCEECISNFYLSNFNSYCTSTDNCYLGDKDTGLCLSCNEKYYLDYKDGKCKSNLEDNEFKYCRILDGECKECSYPYYLAEDYKCSNTKNCASSENGICESCLDNYYISFDNICSNVEHCIYSNKNFECIECEEKYYYDKNKKICVLGDNNFENCKYSDFNGKICEKCKDGFYLNLKNHSCHSNKKLGDFYGCEETDRNGEYCNICISGFYHVEKYNKCSEIEGCEIQTEEKKCLECKERFVLNKKNGNCEINYKIINEEKKFYFRCNKTNEEGTKCEVCLNGLDLEKNGLCIENAHCFEEKNGICKKCKKNENEYLDYCLNSDFGCVPTYMNNCLECDDILDINKCTKCIDGFKLNSDNICLRDE